MRRRIRKRYEAAIQYLPKVRLRPALALRESLAAGYGKKDLVADVLAGVVVGLVALPLAMALGINSGVAPENGIYTAIIGGAVVAVLGGSRVQVSGPTAAFVVILAPIGQRYGLGGLAVATILAGVILVIMGAARLGRLVEFIPHPVTTGFTAGIAVVIASLQVKDFFGLTEVAKADHFGDRMAALAHAFHTVRWEDASIGVLTLLLLVLWPRVDKRVPAPLVALATAGFAAWLAAELVDGFHVATIRSSFGGIPSAPPTPMLPWTLPDGQGQPFELSYEVVRALLGPAFAIAVLGAIESLLCATVADGMAGTRHDPDTELVAQGVGNVVSPFFGGIAVTGALARTATNVRAGARSPVASLSHAVFVLLGVVVLAPVLSYLPMAALAALLFVVAYNMSEQRHFRHIVQVAPRSDVLVLLTCFFLTVVFDMVVSVSVGIMLAALLFMRRMAEIASTKVFFPGDPAARTPLPAGVLLYEIAGPLFFGATQKAMESLHSTASRAKLVILDMSAVPAMDATALVALESALSRLKNDATPVIVAGAQVQPREVLARAGIAPTPGVLTFTETRDEAVALASAQRRESIPQPATPAPPEGSPP